MQRMQTPRTRAEFERNLYLLGQNIRERKLHLPQNDFRLEEGLLRMRYLPNGRIDFLSIDEVARNLSNMISQSNEKFEEEIDTSQRSKEQNQHETP